MLNYKFIWHVFNYYLFIYLHGMWLFTVFAAICLHFVFYRASGTVGCWNKSNYARLSETNSWKKCLISQEIHRKFWDKCQRENDQ